MEWLCDMLPSLANQHIHLAGHQILALGIAFSEDTASLMESLSLPTEDTGVLGPVSLSH